MSRRGNVTWPTLSSDLLACDFFVGLLEATNQQNSTAYPARAERVR